MAESRYLILTRAVGQAIGHHDAAAHSVDAAETRLRDVEANLETTAQALRDALDALHAEFPELTRGYV